MNNFLANIMSNLSEQDKAKLGTGGGTKINSAGSHLVTISEFFVGEYDGKPNVSIKFESADGKSVEWTGNLTSEVQYKDGAPTRQSYTYQGQPLVNPAEKAPCDNTQTLGKIQNLCKLLGTTIEEASAACVMETVTSFGKQIQAPVYKSLIGKSLTIVTSTQVSVDKKTNKAWRNQVVSMNHLFNADGLSLAEIAAGKTVGTAIDAAVALANRPAEQYADIGYHIKHSDQSNKIAIQELKLVAGTGKEPVANDQTAASEDEDIFN